MFYSPDIDVAPHRSGGKNSEYDNDHFPCFNDNYLQIFFRNVDHMHA